MTDFESYMKMNVHYEYLQKYYKSEDIASIYGVSKYEIKHSNVLSWILKPKANEAIDYFPIRNLLKLIQKNNVHYDFFNSVDLNVAKIDKLIIQREKYNIDMLITLKIDGQDYLIALENKLESLIHDNQLKVYKDKVESIYTRCKKLYVFLHPGINILQENEANDNQYVTITYQDIYDYILKSLIEISTDSTVKLIVNSYIHSLCCYDSNYLIGLIVADEERKSLENLFNDKKILTMIDSLCNNEYNEYTTYYKQNKAIFIKIFNKYLHITNNEVLRTKITKILNTKSYIFNGVPYNGIANLLKDVFQNLLKTHTVEELQEIIYLYSEADPLLVAEQNLSGVDHKKWYLYNPKEINYNGVKYYVLSSWLSDEYEELKEKINELNKISPNIYGKINLE